LSLIDQLKTDEGFRALPYRDTQGYLTIGYGLNLDAGITEPEAAWLLENRVNATATALVVKLPWVSSLDQARQDVLVNMAYNLGLSGLLAFKNTLSAVQDGDYTGAASGMLASKWATQVGARAQRLAQQMRTGVES